MPIVSDHLLLAIPFHKTHTKHSNQWLDHTSRNGQGSYVARANRHCTASTLDKLGTCVQIKPRGQLTIDTGDIAPTLAAATQQITIEFWAEPADGPDSTSNGQRRQQLLTSGAINVWLEGRSLHWQINNTLTQAIADVTGLHHWAIVVDNFDAAPSLTIYRDGAACQVVSTAIAPPTTESQPKPETALTTWMIGAEQNGWTGKLAHLRIWSAALDAAQLEKNIRRDVTAHTSFKASTGFEWQLLNGEDEPALYIQGLQTIFLEIHNVTQSTHLVIPKDEGSASVEHYHLQLVFRPGTLANQALENFKEAFSRLADNTGWDVSVDQWEEQDCLSFLWVGTANIAHKSLNNGEKLKLQLPGLAAAPGSGSRTSRVMLRYDQLQLNSDGREIFSGPISGNRIQLLNILYRPFGYRPFGYRKLPLDVGVVGAPVVLTNGEKETSLTLYLKNLKSEPLVLGTSGDADETPKFMLEVDAVQKTDVNGQELHLKGLADDNDWNDPTSTRPDIDINKSAAQTEGTVSWDIIPKLKSNDGNEQSPEKIGFTADEVFLLTLKFKTTVPPGRSIVRLRYKDFADYGEGVFELPIDIVAAVPTKVSDGGAGYGLALGHDPRVDHNHPNAEALPEMLSVFKEKGNGDAVKIENSGSGAGLTITNKSASNGLNVKQTGDGGAVRIENAGSGAGLTIDNTSASNGLNVVQSGRGLAAQFTGGSGVEILGNLNLRTLQITETTSEKGENEKSVSITTSTSNNNRITQINRDLNLYLRLDQLDVSDTSGKGHSCNKSGNPQVFADSQMGNCLKFNGGQTISCDGISLANKSFTIQFWAKRQEVNNSDHGWIMGQGRNSNHKGLHIGFRDPSNESTLAFAFYGNDANLLHQTGTDWHHWACVYDNDKKERMIFRDGIEVKRQFEIEPYTGSGTFYIGKITFTGLKFKGYLSDVRVHYRALSAADVLLCMKEKLDEILIEQLKTQKEQNGQVLVESTPAVHIEKTNKGDLKVSSRIRDKTGEVMPVGAVLPFAGKFPPDGWLLCAGQTVRGEEYKDLSKVLYGDDSDEVKVPDYRQKFLAGATGVGDYALRVFGGQDKVRLETQNLPVHNHEIDFNNPENGAHNHTIRWGEGGGKGNFVDSTDYDKNHSYDASDMIWGGNHSHHIKGSTKKSGGLNNPEPHENRPPYVALNYIIKY